MHFVGTQPSILKVDVATFCEKKEENKPSGTARYASELLLLLWISMCPSRSYVICSARYSYIHTVIRIYVLRII